ncbi:MAG: hypothetical protein J2P50_00040 [Hyphomicrobiaceae bacterium]|nr:hypothetical protein [Hyphomicrobiaceae bacterium]
MLWLVLAFVSVAPPVCAAETDRAEPVKTAETANDVARFIAGLEPAADSPLAPFTHDASWQQHAKSLDAAWARLEEERLTKIRAWAVANLIAPQPVVLYMFSGPDFLYLDAFFSDRTTYVMSGLEPIGQIPTIESAPRRSLGPALAGLRASVGTALNYSFFITSQMKSSLAATRLNGVLPVLYLFLARSGKTIQEVTLIGVDKDGAVVAPGAKDATPGVKITFAGHDGRTQTLYYFQTDLSDGGVKHSGFLKFCERLGRADVFIKSASYLLHTDNFAMVRGFLIDHATAIVQDDSGIPVRHFKAQDWQLRPFGKYLGPIAVFYGMYQRGLSEVFRRSNPPKLEFGVGYRWRPQESNLLLAVRTPLDGMAQETPK